ncbi:MAG: hypothetical protein LBS60_13910 [Deltaproteobacteria bacterium]|jgi:hypothetical protein|nr:hypothetical protein [Deltaproteobacteria bacterium]
MTTITKTIDIPADRRLKLELELPDSLPPGKAELMIWFVPTPKVIPPKTVNETGTTLNEPQKSAKGLSRAVEILCSLPDDFLIDRVDDPPQKREFL